MTSLSLRKLLTTQSSTPTWTRAETLRTAGAVSVMLLACASAAFGGRDPAVRRASASESNTSEGEDDPLAKLRARSARQRWSSPDQVGSRTPAKSQSTGKTLQRTPLQLGNDDEVVPPATTVPDFATAPSVPYEPPALRPAPARSPRATARISSARRSNPEGSSEGSDGNEQEPPVATDSAEVAEMEDAASGATNDQVDDPYSASPRGRLNPTPSGAPGTNRHPSAETIASGTSEEQEVAENADAPTLRAKSGSLPDGRPVASSRGESDESSDSAEVEPVVPPQSPNALDMVPGSYAPGRRGMPAPFVGRSGNIQVAQTKSTVPPDPVRDPRQLPKISTIQPFYDYDPDPERQKDDRCHSLCPRPKYGCPDCKKNPDGTSACPDCPEEIQLSKAHLAPRNFAGLTYCWAPTNLWNYPLYFEDYELERYGHTRGCLQPLWSVGRFGVQLFALPYQMTIDPICKKRYALGYYRPGSCVPCKYYQAPWNTEAALVEAGVLTGAYYLFAP